MSSYAVQIYRERDQYKSQQEFEALLSQHLKFTQKIGIIGYKADDEQSAYEGAFSACMNVKKEDVNETTK